MSVTVLGRDETGHIVAESIDTYNGKTVRMRYYLTPCCLASAKGMEDYVGCRACYHEIDPIIGSLPEQDGPLFEAFGDGLPYDTYKTKREAGLLA